MDDTKRHIHWPMAYAAGSCKLGEVAQFRKGEAQGHFQAFKSMVLADLAEMELRVMAQLEPDIERAIHDDFKIKENTNA